MEQLHAFHLLIEGEELIGGDTLQFFQGIVVYAQNVAEAEAKAGQFLSSLGAKLLSIDPEETRIVDPESVGYARENLPEGFVGMTGRIWVKPKRKRWGAFLGFK
jgi:hypothetical protein